MSENQPESSPDNVSITKGKDIEYLESLSTAELENLMRFAFLESEPDVESLEKMMSVYEERNEIQPLDTAAAWERFQLYYSGYEETFPYEDADNPIQTRRSKKNVYPHVRKRVLRFRNIAAALIVVMILFYVSPASAYFIPAIANWRGGVFWFGQQNMNSQIDNELVSLHDVLADYGVTDKVAPTWLPDGFSLLELSIIPSPSRTIIHVLFGYDKKELTIQVIILSDSQVHSYEMDDGGVEVYRRNEVEHQLLTNNGKLNVIWTSGNYECAITGDISVDEAKKMIDSIYER